MMRYLPPMGRTRSRLSSGFTFVEIVISISILLLLLAIAVPSLNGVLADRRLRRSFDGFNDLVRQAQERSVTERRTYLIVWEDKGVILRPEVFAKKEPETVTAQLPLRRGEVLKLTLPAALVKKPPGEWIFWPSGICEPAIIEFKGRDGSWTANYSPLTGRAELVNYGAR
jgi:type II secretory pathway pseudopilin PulG